MANIHIPPGWRLKESEATPESAYLDRRKFVTRLGGGVIAGSGMVAALAAACKPARGAAESQEHGPLDNIPDTPTASLYPDAVNDPRFTPGDRHKSVSSEEVVATYNNFYEFGTDKDGVWQNVRSFEARPWAIEVSGLVDNPGVYDLVDLERLFPLEERIYRHRCVERWSVVVPWIGFPLARLIEHVQPRNRASHVAFTTFDRPEQAFGQKSMDWYPWPYAEGLRMDEAMNDLAFVVTGMYGHPLQKQNGAPVRIHLPWKYGYKSPKSIVSLEVTDRQPPTFWNESQASEYGFYSNVDPGVPHPRWPQTEEEIVGTGERVPTLPFNGYGEWVGELYGGRVTPLGDVPHAR